MRLILALVCVALFALTAQTQNTNSSTTTDNTNATVPTKKRRPPIFRATKDQIMKAQTMLKEKSMYAGEATGKLDPDTRAALKKYQAGESIRATGTPNRVTLEKMGIELTERQRAM